MDAPRTTPRPRPEDVDWATKRARRATILVLIPFLLALGAGAGLRVSRTFEATDDIANVAVSVANDPALDERISAVADHLVQDRYGTVSESGAAAEYRLLVEAVAGKVRQMCQGSCSQPPEFAVEEFRAETWDVFYSNTIAIVSLQGLLILFFPALFIVSFIRARKSIAHQVESGSEGFASLISEIQYGRQLRFLQREGGRFFWRRFGFALLVAVATTYFFAPVGLRASIIGEYYSALETVPGRSSTPFFVTHLALAPPLVVGLAGFFLYSTTTMANRFRTGDLRREMFIGLFNRGVTVFILGLVLSGITTDDNVARALIFVVGMFPRAGIDAIGKTAQVKTADLLHDTAKSFAGLPELDAGNEASLKELGISSVHELAQTDWTTLVESVGMSPRVLLRAADRALLLDQLGPDLTARLQSVPVFRASELLALARDGERNGEVIRAALEVTELDHHLRILESHPNMRFLVDLTERYGATAEDDSAPTPSARS